MFFLSSSFLTALSLVLRLPRVSVTVGVNLHYLVCCVTQHSMEEISGAKQLRELDRAIEGPLPISSTGICSFMQGGRG